MEFKTSRPVILASGSPRRKEILQIAGIPFLVQPSTVDEPPIQRGERPNEYAERLALLKARDVAGRQPEAVVIGSDTVVHQEGLVFGKPKDREEAKRFLETLVGGTHSVSTGVSITDGRNERTFSVETEVEFRAVPDWLIDEYVASGDPMDKAGAYGIQSGGALFVKEIKGDYHAVMGLPVAEVFETLCDMGVIVAGEGDEP